jgi:hypothetical protein
MSITMGITILIIAFVWVVIGLIFSTGSAPSRMVYPREYQIRTPEEKEKFFKKLGVQYTSCLIFSKECEYMATLPKEDLCAYSTSGPYYNFVSSWYAFPLANKQQAATYIQWVSDQVGYGLFADQDIPKGSFIMEYAGEVVKYTYDSTWAWTYPGREGFWHSEVLFTLDARVYGNEARFANHAEDPNVGIERVYYDNAWRLIYVAARDIKKGEELFIHYGHGYWTSRKRMDLQAQASVAA